MPSNRTRKRPKDNLMSQKTQRVPLSTSAHDARSPLSGLARYYQSKVAMNIRNLTSDSFESVIHIHFLKHKSLLLLFLIDFSMSGTLLS